MKKPVSEFGTMPGEEVINLYTFKNKNSVEVKIINYGGGRRYRSPISPGVGRTVYVFALPD